MATANTQVVSRADAADPGRGNDFPVASVGEGQIAFVEQTDTVKHVRPANAKYTYGSKPANLDDKTPFEVQIIAQQIHRVNAAGIWIKVKNNNSVDDTTDKTTYSTQTLTSGGFTVTGEIKFRLKVSDGQNRTLQFFVADSDSISSQSGTHFATEGDLLLDLGKTKTELLAGTAGLTMDLMEAANTALEKYQHEFAFDGRFSQFDVSTTVNTSPDPNELNAPTITVAIVGTNGHAPRAEIANASTDGAVTQLQINTSKISEGAMLLPTYCWIQSLESQYGGSSIYRSDDFSVFEDTLIDLSHEQLTNMADVTLNGYRSAKGASLSHTWNRATGSKLTEVSPEYCPPRFHGSISQNIVLPPGDERWVYIPITNQWLTNGAWLPSLNQSIIIRAQLSSNLFSGVTPQNRTSTTAKATLQKLVITDHQFRMYGEAFLPGIASRINAIYMGDPDTGEPGNLVYRRQSFLRNTQLDAGATLKGTSGNYYEKGPIGTAGTFADMTFRLRWRHTNEENNNLCARSSFVSNSIYHSLEEIELQDASGQAYNLSAVPGQWKQDVEQAYNDDGTACWHIRSYRWCFNRSLRCFVQRGIRKGAQYVGSTWKIRAKPYNYANTLRVNSATTTSWNDAHSASLYASGHQFGTWNQHPNGSVVFSFF